MGNRGTRSSTASHPVPALASGASRDARQDAVVATIRTTGMTVRSAGLACHVPPSTLFRWLNEEEGFRERCDFAFGEWERMLARVVATNAVSLRSWKAALAALSRRIPEWAEHSKLDVKVGAPLPTGFEALTDAEIDELLASVRARR